MFTATLGGGAWLHAGDGPPVALRCNTGVPLDQALVSTGFGYEVPRRVVQGQVVGALLPQVRDIRRGGSCAVDLCSLAAGRVDAYYERGVNYWDYAAGGLVATEAGAVLGGLAGRPASLQHDHRGRARSCSASFATCSPAWTRSGTLVLARGSDPPERRWLSCHGAGRCPGR